MKKFVFALALAKLALLSVFGVATFSGCQRASLSPVETAQTTPTVPPTVAPAASPKIDDNINRPTSEPYKGELSIFEGADRAKNLQIERVMDVLQIKEGKNVADIGAGSGWFTIRAAKRVGEKGKGFAVEINQEYIDYINSRAKKENFPNVQTVLGTEEDPKLPADSIDAVLILKTYHEIAQPVKVLENLRKSLRKDARIGVIDRNGNGTDHGIQKEVVVDEAKRAGFALKEDYDFVKPDGMDYFLVFQAVK